MSPHRNPLPTNTPDTFGAPTPETQVFTADLISQAPPPREGTRPAVARIHTGPRANHILFTFTPGQQLTTHQAAHPITVSCPKGQLIFTVEGQQPVLLEGGAMMHLDAYIPHSVEVPADAPGAILWLIMHTPDSEH
ncbi:hypothetical protein [Corynebacterium aquilae]|uniref:LuxR family transcriptional regulator n=1 Tax=Corynebacterium aquilae DSM 44791 TaxID=1431546 RepID=A0A1L7CGR3_9CORY|nr:hypothetical protein [Corynebacterium aquilae]APT85019.1 hypothetical protein CAQU_07955 [Corynebacterium aquilae DSM 44791]